MGILIYTRISVKLLCDHVYYLKKNEIESNDLFCICINLS